MILQVETKINRTIDVEVHTDDILEALNNETIERRFNFFGAITNNLVMSDIGKLRTDQKVMIKIYLERQLNAINKSLEVNV